MDTTEDKSYGALFGSVVVVILLIAGGIYVFKNNMNPKVAPPAMEETATVNAVDEQTAQTDSDLSNVEADLNSVDLDSLDKNI